MLTHLFLATALAAVLPDPPFQDAGRTPSSATQSADLDAEFQAVKRKYQSALSHYQAMRLEAVGKSDEKTVPTHPAREFLPQFWALSEAGQCRAMGWIFTNLNNVVDDPAEARRQAEYLFAKMIADVSNDACMLDALIGIASQTKNLGEDTAVEMCRMIESTSTVPEVRARAMHAHSLIVSDNGRTRDQTRLSDADAIQQAVLDTYPTTTVAREIAGDSFHATQKELIRLEKAWLVTVRDLVARGRPMSEWPEQPIHLVAKHVQRIADIGIAQARAWYDAMYVGYTLNEKQGGLPQALSYLVAALRRTYSMAYAEWDPIRMGILEVLFRMHPTEPWVYDALRNVIESSQLVAADLVEPVTQVLLEKNKDPAVRALALYTLARSLVDRGNVADYERAIPMYREIVEKYPESDLVDPAQRLLSRLVNVMPGGKFPYFAHTDSGGVDLTLDDYKGRVVMLEFYSLKFGDYTEAAAQRAPLVKQMAGRPFSMIGFNVDLITAKAFLSKSEQLGINWRTVMLLSRSHVIKWEVNKFPTTILLDSDHVVRARDLAWPEMVKVSERLVAEAEQKQPKK